MRIRQVASILAAVLMAGLVSAEVPPITVTVNNSTLGNPIGAGFGWWEGAEPLDINLQADPGEITRADPYLPEEVIWNPTDSSQPDPWTFETAAILPDKAFAVIFKGTLTTGGTGGTGGSPTEWATAVSDIDIDCDSDNDSTDTGRPPSDTDAEDALEFVDGSSSTTPHGMVMASGESWAQLRITGHIKRSGMVTIELGGDTSAFEIAEYTGQDYVVLEQIQNPAYTPESGSIAVYEDTEVPAGSYSKTLYIRPTGTGADEDQVVVGAFFSPPPDSAPASRPQEQTAKDKASATQRTWSLDAPSRTVMVEADNNYDDPAANDPPYNPAKMKKMTVKGPANQPFVLKRLYPQGQSSKLRVYKSDKTTEVTWANDVSEDLTVAATGVTEFWVKGLAGTVANANTKASTNANDQHIELWTGTQGNPGAKQDASDWTALWVKLEIEITGAIPDDNKAKGTYKLFCEQDALGHIGQGVKGNTVGIKYGVQLKGTVYSADMPLGTTFSMRRFLIGVRLYLKPDGQPVELTSGSGLEEDTSEPAFKDEVHKTNGSTDKIYDLDIPGWKGSAEGDNTLAASADKTHVAARANFKEWVELDGERCSEMYPWYYRRASKKNGGGAQGQWNTTNAAPGDNTAARGTTALGWDLQNLPMTVSLTTNKAYQKDNLNAAFTATVVGGTANFTYHWEFGNAANPNPADVTKAARTDQQNMAFAANKQNHGEHFAAVQVTDSAAPQHRDHENIRVLTNKPPIPQVYADIDRNGQKVVVFPRAVDPDNAIVSYKFKIDYYKTVGPPETSGWKTKADGAQMNKPWSWPYLPADLDYIVVTMKCTDEYDAEGTDQAYDK